MPNIAAVMYLADLVDNFGVLFVVVGCLGLFSGLMVLAATADESTHPWKFIVPALVTGALSLVLGIAMPSKNVIYVYAGQQLAEHVVEIPAVQTEAGDIYKDLKAILHNLADGEEKR